MNDEWDAVIQELGRIEADLNYESSQQFLRRFLQRLDLTERENYSLAPSLAQLRGMMQRLEQSVVQIAVFGLVGRGKSSILNALLGDAKFAVDVRHGMTTGVERSPWSPSPKSSGPSPSGGGPEDDLLGEINRIALPALTQARVELIDTPGIDEIDGAQRATLAESVAKQADLILFVVAGDLTAIEYAALSALRQLGKPMVLVFNKMDQYPEVDRAHLYATLRDQRVKELLSPDNIVMAAAHPLVTEVVRQPDGRKRVQRRRGAPNVTALKLKILDILQRDGKALVALNTMLYADEVNEQILSQKTQIRDRAANELIWSVVMVKAIAIALNPITVLDVLSGAAIDVVMVVVLSRLYGIPMTPESALNLLRSIAVGMGGISISELLTTLGLGSLKSALGAAIPATGGLSLAPYVSVAIAQAGVAGVSTYAIGQISKHYLANGASWGDQSPKAAIRRILDSLDETSLLYRVKAELAARLQPPPLSSPAHKTDATGN
ncbi:MAG: GTP-binding protein [Leptolyngbyaceae bacterium]|nr:GTP-binding protein [Leptolyngbyaceae bacterium]